MQQAAVPFSSILISKVQPILSAIFKHPFVVSLANGTLDIEKFKFYMIQDAMYLRYFAKGLALLAAKSDTPSVITEFAIHAKDSIEAELQLHQHYFTIYNVENVCSCCF